MLPRRRPPRRWARARRTWIAALGVAAAGPVWADADLTLPAWAFKPTPDCPLDPLSTPGLQRLEDRLMGRCHAAADGLRRLAPVGGGSQGGWRLEQQMGLQGSQLAARVRVRWGALVNGTAGASPVSAQTEVAAGLWWRPDTDFALQLRHGRRQFAAAAEAHTDLTGAWRWTDTRLLYTSWDDHNGQSAAAPRLGVRWWLVPSKVLFDLAWPTDGLAQDPMRVRLSWRGFSL